LLLLLLLQLLQLLLLQLLLSIDGLQQLNLLQQNSRGIRFRCQVRHLCSTLSD
jgi:hypothetical protein